MSEDVVARVYEALGRVWDPELAVDVVSLGLIYGVRVDPEDGIEIDMTLTTPGCPVSDSLPGEARKAVAQALPQFPVRVDVVWDPPWTPERMSGQTAQTLGFGKKLRI